MKKEGEERETLKRGKKREEKEEEEEEEEEEVKRERERVREEMKRGEEKKKGAEGDQLRFPLIFVQPRPHRINTRASKKR